MLVAVLLLAIPLALFGSVLRLDKRRFTLRGAMLWLAFFAGDFAMIRAEGELSILALWLLYAAPHAFLVLHVPKNRDAWIAAFLAAAATLLWVVGRVSDEQMRRRIPPPVASPVNLLPAEVRTTRSPHRS